jgi:hypothetical protein
MALSISGGSVTKEGFARTMKKDGAGGVIGKVTADKGHLESKTLSSAGNFRVDSQTPTGSKANLQVQVNGVTKEKSSIGGALIPAELYKSIGNTNAPGKEGATAKARQAELTKAIQGALTRSVGTWTVVEEKKGSHGEYRTFVVGGTFSA